VPEFYNTNPITGLIYVVPFVLFSLVPLSEINLRKLKSDIIYMNDTKIILRWIIVVLYGSFLLTLSLLLLFFWAAMRYMADFMSMLMVLSIIGYCRCYIYLQSKYRESHIATIGMSLGIASIAFSIALGLAETKSLFQELNPVVLSIFHVILK